MEKRVIKALIFLWVLWLMGQATLAFAVTYEKAHVIEVEEELSDVLFRLKNDRVHLYVQAKGKLLDLSFVEPDTYHIQPVFPYGGDYYVPLVLNLQEETLKPLCFEKGTYVWEQFVETSLTNQALGYESSLHTMEDPFENTRYELTRSLNRGRDYVLIQDFYGHSMTLKSLNENQVGVLSESGNTITFEDEVVQVAPLPFDNSFEVKTYPEASIKTTDSVLVAATNGTHLTYKLGSGPEVAYTGPITVDKMATITFQTGEESVTQRVFNIKSKPIIYTGPTLLEKEDHYEVSFRGVAGVGVVEFLNQTYKRASSGSYKIQVPYGTESFEEEGMKVSIINAVGESSVKTLPRLSSEGSEAGVAGEISKVSFKSHYQINGKEAIGPLKMTPDDILEISLSSEDLMQLEFSSKYPFSRRWDGHLFHYYLALPASVFKGEETLCFYKNGLVYDTEIPVDIFEERPELLLLNDHFYFLGDQAALLLESSVALDYRVWIDEKAVALKRTDQGGLMLPLEFRDGTYHSLSFYGLDAAFQKTKGYTTRFLWHEGEPDHLLYTSLMPSGETERVYYCGETLSLKRELVGLEGNDSLKPQSPPHLFIEEVASGIEIQVASDREATSQLVVDGRLDQITDQKKILIPYGAVKSSLYVLAVDDLLLSQDLFYERKEESQIALPEKTVEAKVRKRRDKKASTDSKPQENHEFTRVDHQHSSADGLKPFTVYESYTFEYVNPMWFKELLDFREVKDDGGAWIRVNHSFFPMTLLSVSPEEVILPQQTGDLIEVSLIRPDFSILDLEQLNGSDQDVVVKAYLEDLVHGYPDGTFKADNLLTFAEFYKILSHCLKDPSEDLKGTSESHLWYRPYEVYLESFGIECDFKPSASVTGEAILNMTGVAFDGVDSRRVTLIKWLLENKELIHKSVVGKG